MDEKVLHEEIELDIRELLFVLLNKLWIIVFTGIGIALVAFLVSKYAITPTYESTTKIYIMNKQSSSNAITLADLQSGTQLTKDYMTLVTSRPVIEQVITKLELDLKYKDLTKLIKVVNPSDTRLLNITVSYHDPYLAKAIADAIREASSVHIRQVMDIDQVTVAEEGNIPELPASPSVGRNTILGGILGLFLAIAIILLIHIIDDTIKTPDDLEKYLGLSVLSSIPCQEDKRKKNKSKKVKK